MTITSRGIEQVYRGNGAAREFPFPHECDPFDLIVRLFAADGSMTHPYWDWDTWERHPANTWWHGSIVLAVAPPVGTFVVITRVMELTQPFPVEDSKENVETACDRIVMLTQQLAARPGAATQVVEVEPVVGGVAVAVFDGQPFANIQVDPHLWPGQFPPSLDLFAQGGVEVQAGVNDTIDFVSIEVAEVNWDGTFPGRPTDDGLYYSPGTAHVPPGLYATADALCVAVQAALRAVLILNTGSWDPSYSSLLTTTVSMVGGRVQVGDTGAGWADGYGLALTPLSGAGHFTSLLPTLGFTINTPAYTGPTDPALIRPLTATKGPGLVTASWSKPIPSTGRVSIQIPLMYPQS